jgi:hypothetical protein
MEGVVMKSYEIARLIASSNGEFAQGRWQVLGEETRCGEFSTAGGRAGVFIDRDEKAAELAREGFALIHVLEDEPEDSQYYGVEWIMQREIQT